MKEIIIKGKNVKYELTRKNVKNINMRVKDDGIIYISADSSVRIKEIEGLIEKNADFFIKSLRKIEIKNENRPDKNILMYLGKKYIKVIKKGLKDECYIDGDRFMISLKDTEDCKKEESLIEKWYNKEAQKIFGEINENTAEIFEKFNVKKAEIKVRKMISRWGSCSPYSGRIRINRYLIEYPKICVEYVFVHEYTHFIYHGHGREFYEFVKKIIPDYKNIEKFLEIYGKLGES